MNSLLRQVIDGVWSFTSEAPVIGRMRIDVIAASWLVNCSHVYFKIYTKLKTYSTTSLLFCEGHSSLLFKLASHENIDRV